MRKQKFEYLGKLISVWSEDELYDHFKTYKNTLPSKRPQDFIDYLSKKNIIALTEKQYYRRIAEQKVEDDKLKALLKKQTLTS